MIAVKHLIVVVVILCVIAAIVYMNHSSDTKESFVDTPTPDPNATVAPSPTPTVTCPVITPDWWAVSPIKSIISKYSGISVNVIPADFPDYSGGNIDSNYQVMIESANTAIPKGALSVANTGVFSKSVIDKADTNQLWKIKRITSVDDLKTLSGNPTMNVTNMNYPYYLIVSLNTLTATTVRVLQYENGTLSVRPLGDYISQQWDISAVNVTPGIPILNNNQLSNFSPEYVDGGVANSAAMLNSSNNQQIMASLNQILGYIQANGINQTPTQSVFGSSANAASTPLTVNVRLGANVNRAVTGSVSSFADTSPSALLKKFDEAAVGNLLGTTGTATPQSINGLCTTPNMSDYVSKEGIPCTACAGF